MLLYRPAIWAVQVRQKGLAVEKQQIFEMQDLPGRRVAIAASYMRTERDEANF